VAGTGGHALSEQAVMAALDANPSLDPDDVRSVLVPLARYLGMRADHARALRTAESEFLGTPDRSAPFVVGVVGPVAVGKSTLAATLEALLAGPDATVVSTDSFLYPNSVLAERGIVDRKGFPESYDWDALTAFLLAVRSGEPGVTTPVYSHDHYDVLEGASTMVGEPGVLVVEGLNLLQSPPTPGTLEPGRPGAGQGRGPRRPGDPPAAALTPFCSSSVAHHATYDEQNVGIHRSSVGEHYLPSP
jgi:type I pantothenate kinase